MIELRLTYDQIDKLYSMLERNTAKSTIFIHFTCLVDFALVISESFWCCIYREMNNVKIMIEYINPKFTTIWSIIYMVPLYLPSDSMSQKQRDLLTRTATRKMSLKNFLVNLRCSSSRFFGKSMLKVGAQAQAQPLSICRHCWSRWILSIIVRGDLCRISIS